MNNSKYNNDDTFTVVPRIIDPKMKFTRESLESMDIGKNKKKKMIYNLNLYQMI